MTARLKPVQPGKSSLVTVLDIGSTKMACVIARLVPSPERKALKERTHVAEVIGFGHGKSDGVKSGVISDLARAEQAVRNVVGMAERQAGAQDEEDDEQDAREGVAPAIGHAGGEDPGVQLAFRHVRELQGVVAL